MAGTDRLPARDTGVIRRLVTDKGYGFLGDRSGVEYFFHSSAYVDCLFEDLQVGTPVTFQPSTGPKGPRAENVERVASAF